MRFRCATASGSLRDCAGRVARLFERLTDTDTRYRPEKHYMRGPGLKAKRATKQE